MDLHISAFIALLFRVIGHRGRDMSSIDKASKGVEHAADANKAAAKERPTVTTSGQVMWSTRDLLFPTGHAQRSAVKAGKK
jgi:hypothetical protein